ncbi:hypothetical protein ACIRVF_29900 [Kitasatospora sp. NPDC101157]|uniref:hypothetical protein n=1 Tax=Kitasatospora sp. NPDC101157 TaxID=3364098 RepID=UPI00381A8BDF
MGGILVGLLLAAGSVTGYVLGLRRAAGALGPVREVGPIPGPVKRPVLEPAAEPAEEAVAEAVVAPVADAATGPAARTPAVLPAATRTPRAGRTARALADEDLLAIETLRLDLDAAVAARITDAIDADPVERTAQRRAEAALASAERIRDGAGRTESLSAVLRQGRTALEEMLAGRAERRDATAMIAELRERLELLPPQDITDTPDGAAAPHGTDARDDAGAQYDTAEALRDRRAAEAALDRAEQAARGLERDRFKRVLGAVGSGRVALLRLEARLAGRRVPLELVSPEELAKAEWELRAGVTPDPYWFEGNGSTEIPIDRPEPGRVALLDIACEGEGYHHLHLLTRTRSSTAQSPFHQDTDPYRGRVLVPVERTHVRIEVHRKARWSMRLRPLSDARELTGALTGRGPEVLLLPAEGDLRLSMHLQQPGANGSVRLVSPQEVADGVRVDKYGNYGRTVTHDLGTFRRTASITGPGLLVVDTPGTWELELTPAPAPRRKH